jgi:hypothetical protein
MVLELIAATMPTINHRYHNKYVTFGNKNDDKKYNNTMYT